MHSTTHTNCAKFHTGLLLRAALVLLFVGGPAGALLLPVLCPQSDISVESQGKQRQQENQLISRGPFPPSCHPSVWRRNWTSDFIGSTPLYNPQHCTTWLSWIQTPLSRSKTSHLSYTKCNMQNLWVLNVVIGDGERKLYDTSIRRQTKGCKWLRKKKNGEKI